MRAHHLLDELLAAMLRAAQIGDWATCDEISQTFAVALDVQLRHEETCSAQAVDDVRQFLAEHRQLRRAAGSLLVHLRSRAIDLHEFHHLETLLREHDAHASGRYLS